MFNFAWCSYWSYQTARKPWVTEGLQDSANDLPQHKPPEHIEASQPQPDSPIPAGTTDLSTTHVGLLESHR